MPVRLGTQHHVFQRAQGFDQHEVLVHHTNAAGDRVLGIANLHRFAKDRDVAAIGRVNSIQHRHQRALAGAVFTNQAMQGALRHREVHVHIGQHIAKALMDAGHLQGRQRWHPGHLGQG